jgi:hypothetical protein
MQHSWKLDIGNEAADAEEQPPILASQERAADISLRCLFHSFPRPRAMQRDHSATRRAALRRLAMPRRHALSSWRPRRDWTRGAVKSAELGHHAVAMTDAAIALLHNHDGDARLLAGRHSIDVDAIPMHKGAGRAAT